MATTMSVSKSLLWHRLVTILMLLTGLVMVCIDLQTIQKGLGHTTTTFESQIRGQPFPWMNTKGVALSHIQGDPTKCRDVIYTGDSRDAFRGKTEDEKLIKTGWNAMAHVVRHSKALDGKTCFAYFTISSPWEETGKKLHPVWGRLPATALVMSAFPKADIFLYMDTDALLAYPDQTPTKMYKALAFDGYGENPSMEHLEPGLIVNKPLTGWLCGQCEKYGLGHGCFNTGALLWKRGPKAELILKKWWESQDMSKIENFFAEDEYFHGWTGPNGIAEDKMAEQNRLMYVFANDPEVQEAVWPVPRARSKEFNSESCPNDVDEDHLPCLQTEFIHGAKWDTPHSCFIHHYADDKKDIFDHAKMMMTEKDASDHENQNSEESMNQS